MRPFARLVLGVCAVLVAALAAGCGDMADKNRYVDRINRAQQAFAEDAQRLSGEITATSSAKEDRRTLERFQGAIDRTAGELRRIEPPAEVRAEHTELIRALESYGAEVDEARTALRSRSPRRLAEAQRRLAEATSSVGVRINAAIDSINSTLRE